jgi:hypothetical protein
VQRFWLTAHWPPLKSSDAPDILNIYIQDRFKEVVEPMRHGDRVLVYELLTGPSERKIIDGKLVVIRRHLGKQAIICDARIATPVHERPNYKPQEFTGRGVLNYKWLATTDDRRPLLVPRLAVNAVFCWGDGHNFHGFNAGRGIRQITSEQYEALTAGQ